MRETGTQWGIRMLLFLPAQGMLPEGLLPLFHCQNQIPSLILARPAVTSSPYLLLLIITKKKTTGITLSPRKQQKTKTLLPQVKILISKTRKKSTWHFLPEYVFPLVFNFSFNLTDLVCVIRQENLAKQLYQQQCRTMQRCHVAVFISVRLIY